MLPDPSWYDFSGKTAVITGGSGVIGGELACALVGCGANVAIVDRNEQLPEALRRPVPAGPGQVQMVYGDVLQRPLLEAAAVTVVESFGGIDLLINAAGGNQPPATVGPGQSFFDLPAEALRFVQDLNLLGTMLPCQVFGRHMMARDSGAILNISSMAADRPLTRVVGYAAAKAGVENFTRWLAVYLAREHGPGLRVNALAPGFFVGRQNRALLLDEQGNLTPRGQTIIDHTPMGRFGAVEELVGAALWLLSPAASFVTGIVVPVDGGFSAFSGV